MVNRADGQSIPRLEAETGIIVKNGIVERFPMIALRLCATVRKRSTFMNDLLFDFSRDDFYVSALAHSVGSVRRTIDELACDGLLAGSEETLRQVGTVTTARLRPARRW